jgi:hypothetical protein
VDRPVVVSFKALPQTILSGADDAVLQHWFDTAPTNVPIYWSYWHEPEDNIAAGQFTAEEYRAAWVHIAALAANAHNPELHATLILMAWTADPHSGRNWQDYYPGSTVIDTMGWDAYNTGWSNGSYNSPAEVYGNAIAVSKQLGKPFGFAETGSHLVPGDDGTGRAAWLRNTAAYLEAQGASWVCYFDSTVGGDFRLLDAPSQTAWRDAVEGLIPPAS